MTPHAPATPPEVPTEWLITRTSGRTIVHLLHDLKELRADGWQVTALLAPDGTVIGLGWRGEAQLSLLGEAGG